MEALRDFERGEWHGLDEHYRGNVWQTQRRMSSLVARGLFEREHPNHGCYGPNWKGRQRSESWRITQKGLAVARVVRVKWHLAGWGDKGPPKVAAAVAFERAIIDDPMPEGA